LNEEMPEFEPDDAQMYLDLYREADAEDSFDHFEEQRDTNMEFLRTLHAPPASAAPCTRRRAKSRCSKCSTSGHARPRTHPAIAELVRARMHWRQAGKLGESYKLRP